MISALVLTTALSLGQCANGACALPGAPVARAGRVVTAPARFIANRRPIRAAAQVGRRAARIATAPFRLLRCR